MFTKNKYERKIAMAKQVTRLAHELPALSSEIHPTHEDIAELGRKWQQLCCRYNLQYFPVARSAET